MKVLYKHSIPYIYLLIGFLMFSCATNLTYQDALSKNRKKIEDEKLLDDARFLVEAKSFNILKTRLAELSTTSGYSSAVVQLGKAALQDHLETGKDIESVAKKTKIKVPSEMSEEHYQIFSSLNSTSKENFDRTFIQVLKRANEENTDKFMEMATDAKDDDVRAFAARKLSMLKSQTKQIENVERELLRTY